jgi:hypothetical protein
MNSPLFCLLPNAINERTETDLLFTAHHHIIKAESQSRWKLTEVHLTNKQMVQKSIIKIL